MGSGANETWYLECKVLKDRPGVLSEITSLMARHSVNILAVTTGIDEIVPEMIRPTHLRFLLQTTPDSQFGVVRNALPEIKELEVLALRKPTSLDMITLKYGLDALIAKAGDM
jgi:ACT domain-containing protein